MYDYVIVGAGPAGITMAYLLAKEGNSILLLEKEKTIGGCHRVRRVYDNGSNLFLFSEHGPRIYSDSYKTLKFILKDMRADFYDFFIPYKYGIFSIAKESINILKMRETVILSIEVMKLIFDSNHGKYITMKNFMERHKFSKKTIEYIDSICRLTDGGDYSKYSLLKFLSLINQQIFYSVYQPNAPLDKKFFPFIERKLIEKGVKIINESEVTDIKTEYNKIVSVNCKGKEYNAKRFIFAIPPQTLSKLPSIFGSDFHRFAKETDYMKYIPVVFHFDHYVKIEDKWGRPLSEWGIGFIVLTDYMKMESKMVISTVITKTDSKSETAGKTVDESSKQEMVNEVYFQLKKIFKNLPPYYKAIVSPGVIREGNKWKDIDTAFFKTTKEEYIPFESPLYNNTYTVGTHNGHSKYNFTSMESAMSNALSLFKKFYPESKGYDVGKIVELVHIIRILIIIILLYITIRFK